MVLLDISLFFSRDVATAYATIFAAGCAMLWLKRGNNKKWNVLYLFSHGSIQWCDVPYKHVEKMIDGISTSCSDAMNKVFHIDLKSKNYDRGKKVAKIKAEIVAVMVSRSYHFEYMIQS